MSIEPWIERLLDAEPDELRGLGETPAARLVRENDDARAAAAVLLESLETLNLSIDDIAIRQSGQQRTTRLVAASGFRFALRTAAATLVVITATLLLARRIPFIGAPPALTEDRMTSTLQADSDRPFAVFETDNPDIAIVWLFPQEVSR